MGLSLHSASSAAKHLVHSCGPYGNSCNALSATKDPFHMSHRMHMAHLGTHSSLASIKGLYGSAHKKYSVAADANGEAW
eukprot:CAMPEP_0184289208 /NCGR_PEP_ID=MMETSP1049-20130417/1650_1 /TAXON_ID=77928 /ORGANISM="Proteomonas sulcata, Strain CCMP704" /LENGTH=78 /DNA_ID=CAMNT_0026595897 /DNA_START=55 /DNA_END=291 /DNA_ORIENTATION=-